MEEAVAHETRQVIYAAVVDPDTGYLQRAVYSCDTEWNLDDECWNFRLIARNACGESRYPTSLALPPAWRVFPFAAAELPITLLEPVPMMQGVHEPEVVEFLREENVRVHQASPRAWVARVPEL